MNIDILGNAVDNFWRNGDSTPIKIWINGHREPDMNPLIFFRKFPSMLGYEKHVMKAVEGRVLDVGCSAGCHAYYLKNTRGVEVEGIEISCKAAQIAMERGIAVHNLDWRDMPKFNFDHALALMNGMGLAQSLSELDLLFKKLNKCLKKGGFLWIDSTDVTYAEAFWPKINTEYFGIVEFQLEYKREKQRFPWLFVDRNTAMKKAREAGFSIVECKLEKNGHYLLQLRKIR
jgi:cyclopropane fatty-acyl-phospholipid synthase-like methyltransferase